MLLFSGFNKIPDVLRFGNDNLNVSRNAYKWTGGK